MSEHICTPSSFDTDMTIKRHDCVYCCRTVTAHIGYIGVRCPKCNNINGGEFIGDALRYRRKLLGLTRAQMGELVLRSKHTIQGYEWKAAPEWYIHRTQKMVEHFHFSKEVQK